MRLSARLIIAGLAAVALGSAAGCSASPGLAYAHAAGPSAHATKAAASASAPTTVVQPQAATVPPGPRILVAGAPRGVKAKAGIIADAATGQVLWASSPNAQRPIASITKVMTAYLVIQAGDVDRQIKVPGGVEDYVGNTARPATGCTRGRC